MTYCACLGGGGGGVWGGGGYRGSCHVHSVDCESTNTRGERVTWRSHARPPLPSPSTLASAQHSEHHTRHTHSFPTTAHNARQSVGPDAGGWGTAGIAGAAGCVLEATGSLGPATPASIWSRTVNPGVGAGAKAGDADTDRAGTGEGAAGTNAVPTGAGAGGLWLALGPSTTEAGGATGADAGSS